MTIKETTKQGKIIWDVKEGDQCAYCKTGTIIKRPGKYGSFFACSSFPSCGFTQAIKDSSAS